MFVHAFGAYFGLTVARILWTEDIERSNKEGSSYNSDLFSMIGKEGADESFSAKKAFLFIKEHYNVHSIVHTTHAYFISRSKITKQTALYNSTTMTFNL